MQDANLSSQSPSKGRFRYASFWRRAIAQIIDDCIWFLGMGYVVGLLFGESTDSGFVLSLIPAGFLLLIACTYFTVLEWKFGQTLGKKIVGSRVVGVDGSRLTLRAAIIRTILRIVDWLPFFYVAGCIALLVSKSRQRLGDQVAKTVVVRV